MGFHATVASKADKDPGELFEQVLPEDLLKFGMIPEFIGRLPMVGAVHALDKPALMQILTEPKNALVKQYAKLFEFDDIELDIVPEALEAIAELALTRGTGARGLRSILEETLLDVMYESPGRTDIARVVVSADCVKNKVMPELVSKTAARAPRQRRAAS
jgi:ATP-dependent Clp protease ATP-binding subunit ClpX